MPFFLVDPKSGVYLTFCIKHTQLVSSLPEFGHLHFGISKRTILICYRSSHSDMVYPVSGRQQLAMEDPRLKTGKYEPLVHMNTILCEEVQRVMSTVAGRRVNIFL